jgi:hypothetical protein
LKYNTVTIKGLRNKGRKMYMMRRLTFDCFLASTAVFLVLLGASRSGAAGWGKPVEFSAVNEGRSEVHVELLPSGNAMATWMSFEGEEFTFWSNRYTTGHGWEEAKPFAEGTRGRFTASDFALNTSGDGVVVWNDAQRVLARTSSPTGEWGEIETLDIAGEGIIAPPRVDITRSGAAVALWGVLLNGEKCMLASIWEKSRGWRSPDTVHCGSASVNFDAYVKVDDAGRALAVWDQGRRLWASWYHPSASWSTAAMISTDESAVLQWFKAAFDPAGNTLVTWHAQVLKSGGYQKHIWANLHNASSGWGTPVKVGVDGQYLHYSMSSDSMGRAVVAMGEDGQTNGRIWVRRYEPGKGWGGLEHVHTEKGYIHSIKASADEHGNTMLLWERGHKLVAKRYDKNLGWEPRALVSDAGFNLEGLAADAYGRMMAVWAKRLPDVFQEKFVSSLYVPPGPTPDLTANGHDGPLVFRRGEGLHLEAGLNAGNQEGLAVDYWILARPPSLSPAEWYSYVPGKGWVMYRFYFATDLVPNGRIDIGQMSSDVLKISVEKDSGQ